MGCRVLDYCARCGRWLPLRPGLWWCDTCLDTWNGTEGNHPPP